MKILHLGDLHVGVKGDDPWIQHIQMDAIEQAIKYSVKHGIKNWIQYGDFFDVRKGVTQESMNFARKIIELLSNHDIHMDVIIGNHDLHKKDRLTPNSVSEILRGYPHITIHEKPKTVVYDKVKIDLIPWMCKTNTSEILSFVKKSKSDYCIGHWELNGFYYYKGLPSHGLEPDFLRGYKQVWSGHFHCISEAANVKYIGTPFTITAGDENDPRGFWILDTTDESFTFVENETCWHKKLYYPDDKIVAKDYKNLAIRIVADKIDAGLTKLEGELEEVVHSLSIIAPLSSNVSGDSDEEVSDEIENPSLLDLGYKHIDKMKDLSAEDAKRIKALFNKLWIEAQNQ